MTPPSSLAHWHAHLALTYAQREGQTRLIRREHTGPLLVQRPFYPEAGVCHTLILHPPGGVVGGDRLTVEVDAAPDSHALITTPAATQWYRSSGATARQTTRLRLAPGSTLEWLPQENLLFAGAQARWETAIERAPGARFIGWDITVLGRPAASERFNHGVLHATISLGDAIAQPCWQERIHLTGGDRLLDSPVGLRGQAVFATFMAAGDELPGAWCTACRAIARPTGVTAGITLLPRVLLARLLSDDLASARHYLEDLWACLRPLLLDKPACPPRIWNT